MIFTLKDFKRFCSKIQYPNDLIKDCWTWTASCYGYGYGNFSIKHKQIPAHRFSAIAHNISNPDNKPCVLHTCDKPSCVNPSHLWWGTNLENTQDMENKGRDTKRNGIIHPNAKLTEKQVLDIRSKYIPRIYTIQDIADEYSIDTKTCWRIIHRQTWKHIF